MSASVDREYTQKLLREMIRIPSESGSEGTLASYCAEQLEDLGMEVDVWDTDEDRLGSHPAWNPTSLSYRDRPNVVGVLRGTGGGRSILLNGHLDVVSVESADSWQHGPWDAEVSEDRVYGRGAVDMKGGIAAAMGAAKAVQAADLDIGGDLIIELVVGEEDAMGNAALASMDRGYSADGCVFLEPTSLALCPACRGGFRWRVDVAGKSVHGTRKWLGVDAIEKAVYILEQIRGLERTQCPETVHPLFADSPLDIAVTPDSIHGGEWQGMVPGSCKLEGYFEYLPGEDREWEEKFIRHIELCSETDDWLVKHLPEVEITERFPAFETEPRDPFVENLQMAFESLTGTPAVIQGFNSGCDAYIRSVYAKSPTVIFGPGSLDHAHCVDEFVPLQELFTCADTLAEMIGGWCGQSSTEDLASKEMAR